MSFRYLIYAFSLLMFSVEIHAQEKFWVFLRDKEGVEFNPYEYFDSRTIEKRMRLNIDLFDEDDLPLNENYCKKLEEISGIDARSRWMNAVSMELKHQQKEEVMNLPFVREIKKIESYSFESAVDHYEDVEPEKLLHISRQKASLGAEYFKKKGLDGSGVRIAVFDGGFPGVDTLIVFERMREEGRIIATRDFVKDQDFVYDYSPHGTSVLACIGGEIDGVGIGLGTGAEFLLARTEVKSEVFSEEENWAEAAEWADKNGADIISSSLGYTYHRYFPKQMDGKHTFISRIANKAAGKGMLVINAAGNDGDTEWQVIGAPADADSVLSVGGINSNTGMHSEFSSFGPTFDGRLKPNVVAFSDVMSAGKNGLKRVYGTSFAAPLVTGFAACVKQLHPEWNNMKLFEEICRSGHLYPYYDYAHGYGIPQASYFFIPEKQVLPTFTMDENDGELIVKVLPPAEIQQDTSGGKYIKIIEPQSKFDVKIISEDENGEENKSRVVVTPRNNIIPDEQETEDIRYKLEDNYLYYHIVNDKTGKIRKYRVVKIHGNASFTINLHELRDSEILRIHYKDYTASYSK